MRIVVFTANQLRHKFIANTLTAFADKTLVVSEVIKHDAQDIRNNLSEQEKDFRLRYETERMFFEGHDFLLAKKVLPLVYKEANLSYVHDVVKRFNPDMMFCFGASLLKEPLLSLLPSGHFVNLHLGLSPYYMGSGTNFWPFVNEELEYVGSTLLHIDAGVDTGDIICHLRPEIELGDDVSTIGCKVIQKSASAMVELIKKASNGEELLRVKQWEVANPRYYKKSDINPKILRTCRDNLEGGLVEKYIQKGPKDNLRLISL